MEKLIVKKYKAKKLDDNTWIYGSLLIEPHHKGDPLRGQESYLKYYIISNTINHQVDPNTICEYTGFKDINNKLIYTNDIIAEYFSAVVWCNKSGSYQFGSYDTELKDWFISCHHCEGNFLFEDLLNDKLKVIGNIYD